MIHYLIINLFVWRGGDERWADAHTVCVRSVSRILLCTVYTVYSIIHSIHTVQYVVHSKNQ